MWLIRFSFLLFSVLYIFDERVFNCLELKKGQIFPQIFPNVCPLQSCHKTSFTHKFYREKSWWGIHRLLKFYWNQSLFWAVLLGFNSSFTSKVLNSDIRHLTRSGSIPWPKPNFLTLYSSLLEKSETAFRGSAHYRGHRSPGSSCDSRLASFWPNTSFFFMLSPIVPWFSLVSG